MCVCVCACVYMISFVRMSLTAVNVPCRRNNTLDN